MIILNNSSVADIKYGSQQVDKAYHGSNLVWQQEKWVEYVFPEPNAKMRQTKDYGFEVSAALNTGYGERMSNSPACGLNNNDADAPQINNTQKGYTHHYRIVLPTQFQNAIFCNIQCNNFTASHFNVYAGNYDNFNNYGNWTQCDMRMDGAWNESDFNVQPCKRIDIKTTSSGSSYYMGNFHLKFKIRQSDLQAWKNQYNVL